MSLSSIFDIAGSAMSAQSVRLNTTASNLSNADSAANSAESVYKAHYPVFVAMQKNKDGDDLSQSEFGVMVDKIVESDAPARKLYQPNHIKADKDGYVYYPNVNSVEAMVDMMSASRSYQTSVQLMNTAKTMMQRTLQAMQG